MAGMEEDLKRGAMNAGARKVVIIDGIRAGVLLLAGLA